MRRTLLASVTLTLLCALALGSKGSNTTHARPSAPAQEKIKVSTFVLPGMNMGFTETRATKLNGKTVLTYTVTNESDVPMEKLNFVVFSVGPDGKIKGGEGWNINVDLGAHASYEVPVALERDISSDDALLLTVFRAKGKRIKFEVDPSDVVGAAQATVSARPVSPTGVRYAKAAASAAQTRVDPCIDAQVFAEKSCKCGIKTFSCNPSTGQYTFECFGADGPSCPKTPPKPN